MTGLPLILPSKPFELPQLREWLFRHKTDLFRELPFDDDLLIDDGTYSSTEAEQRVARVRCRKSRIASIVLPKFRSASRRYFRWLIDQGDQGWVRIHPITSSLALLFGPDGTYDLLWRDTRHLPPPRLRPETEPKTLAHFLWWLYHQRVPYGEYGWAQYRFDSGMHRYTLHPMHKDYLRAYASLQDLGLAVTSVRSRRRSLVISELVTKESFFRYVGKDITWMQQDAARRFEAANATAAANHPVSVSLDMARRYCQAVEDTLGVRCRLLTREEHRHIRSIAPDDREGTHALVWGASSHLDDYTRQTWPKVSTLTEPVPWQTWEGLDFIDATDVFEWCAQGHIASRYETRELDPESCGGELSARINFRVVVHAHVGERG